MLSKKTLLALVAAPALALVVACGGDDDGDTQAVPTATQPAQAAAPTRPAGQATQPAGAAAGNELARMGQAFSQLRSFRSQIIIESGGAREEIKMEVVMPDRFRIEMAGLQAINIGNDLWLNIGGTWLHQPGLGGALPITPADLQEAIEDLTTDATVTRGGTDTVGGVRCQILTVHNAVAGEDTEICVAENNLPLRFVYVGATDKTTVIFSDFNANITINRPN